MGEIYAYKVPLPGCVNAIVTTKNDNYIILVNDNKNEFVQQESLQHELEHIGKGHLYSEVKLVGLCEAEAS